MEGARACKACDPGTHTNSSAADRCVRCDTHEYQGMPGQAECLQCPPHSQSLYQGAISLEDCVCMPGFYRADYLNESGVVCRACPTGAACDGQEVMPRALPGHWASCDNPLLFEECLNELACPGGMTCDTCGANWAGKRCGTCSTNAFWSDKKLCQPCDVSSTVLYLLFFLLVCAVALVFYRFAHYAMPARPAQVIDSSSPSLPSAPP